MPIYMQIPDIDGEVKVKGYEKWIELESASQGVTRPGSGGNALSELVVGKYLDSASPKLQEFSYKGKPIKKCQIHNVAPNSAGIPQAFLKTELADMYISSYGFSRAAGDRGFEQMTLSFAKSSRTYSQLAALLRSIDRNIA